jgi:acyl-CoA synthetase (AMP-forming)/AMP-acid ligase II
VTHFCAAPVVLNNLINAPASETLLPLPRVVNVNVAGAAPTPSLLAALSIRGFRVTHTYGLSETYGPSTVCAWKPQWDELPLEERSRLHCRQGIRYIAMEGLDVVDPKTMAPVPADGKSYGEIVLRGNAVMKGYLKNPKANAEAFAGGWYHSGDLGVKHPDGYVEVRDRMKDVIISGGENISSLEVEKVVCTHPAVLEASVVARADERWGESPCAFVTLKDGAGAADGGSDKAALANDIMRFCRERMPGYWVPKSVIFGPLPKTATGKIKKHELRAKAKELGPVKKSRM